jgi:UDP-4-amino-4,6-dideoxy-N-acetyl-beta-L-altrosamine transaminase
VSAVAAALPYGRHAIDDADIAAVTDCLRSGSLTGGAIIERFEAAVAATVGARHAIACSSGTAALHLACLAAGLGAGDAAIVPAITFVATANAVRHTGAEVVFADVDPDTGLMRDVDFEAALARGKAAGHRVRAAIPVHYAGQVVDLAGFADTAARNGVALIEDACHALGSSRRTGSGEDVPVGQCRDSRMAVLSFHPVKAITMGEGGMVLTNADDDAAIVRRARSHGVVREAAGFENPTLADDGGGGTNPWYHEFPDAGFNYRASDLNCALGLSQLGKLSTFVHARRALVDHYRKALARLAPRVMPMPDVAGCRPGWHLFVVLIDFAALGMTRAAVMRGLADRGVATQVHYIPVAWQPCYRRRYGFVDLPGAAAFYRRCLSLPLFPTMSATDVDRVVHGLAEVLEGAGG